MLVTGVPPDDPLAMVVAPVMPAGVAVQVLWTLSAVKPVRPVAPTIATFSTVAVLVAPARSPGADSTPCVETVVVPELNTPGTVIPGSVAVTGPPPVAGRTTSGVGDVVTVPVSCRPKA